MTTRIDPHDPPPAGDGDDEQLACGRLLFEVWQDWEQRAGDPHLRSCPHCREAVRELERLESAVQELREETASASAYDVSGLTRRVMDVVRMELRPGRPLPLGDLAEDLWIMEAPAARTLRAAAETVTGVRAGSCRLTPPRDTGSPAVEVRLEVHAPATVALPETAELVRRRVWEAAEERLGLMVSMVDIRVTDLVDETAGVRDDAGDVNDDRDSTGEGRDR
ncbi:Asp23/Gls24 family envelope stress response protein [Streptomyces sp. NPDC005526]|uniref:Asp23/Gls24 family envelope stress response protein n=1 Tax=Streptomyces sp. NPDC005526 TaxID=3156885 RepID=UPI0033B24BC3